MFQTQSGEKKKHPTRQMIIGVFRIENIILQNWLSVPVIQFRKAKYYADIKGKILN